jgi:FKBP-type peptidyl-prolyl cis-trans isomerase FkpA
MTKHKLVRYAAFCLLLSLTFGCSSETSSIPAPALETDDQKTLYALGLILGRNVSDFKLTAEEAAIVAAGLADAATGAEPKVALDTYGPKVNELAAARAASGADEAKRLGQEFADTVAKEKDVTVTPSGIVIRTITPGTGASPAAEDVVRVHYEGKLINGKVFDSSVQRGEPAEFPLNGVVPCWTEALQTMKKGGKAQIVCPAALAYGDRGAPPDIGPGSTLSFEVELIDIRKP